MTSAQKKILVNGKPQYKRNDFTGWTWYVLGVYIEFVWCKGNLITIALNWRSRAHKTFYILNRSV